MTRREPTWTKVVTPPPPSETEDRRAGSGESDRQQRKALLTPGRLLHLLALLAVVLTLQEFADGYPSLLLMLVLPLWLVVLVGWAAWVIVGTRDGRIARDLATRALVPFLTVGVVLVVSSGVLVDLRFQMSVSQLDALADRIAAGEDFRGPETAGAFIIESNWTDNRGGIYLVIGHANFIDDITLGRDGSAETCSDMRWLDDRWSLCYLHI